MTILRKIMEARKITLAKAKKKKTINELLKDIKKITVNYNFKKTLYKKEQIQVIAEVKKASPSKGIIQNNFKPLAIAKGYEEGGASAISVLTETEFFLGSDDYLQKISEQVTIPTLRKDFIMDPYQVMEAKFLGASAYLLIVDCLELNHLKELIEVGKEQQLTPLVEVHRASEIEIALKAGAEIIGINNRNLRTFETSLERTASLRPIIPSDCIVVSESGIKSNKDLQFLQNLDVHAVLVGETLCREKDYCKAVRNLLGK